MSAISLKGVINALRSRNRKVIIENNYYLQNIFDTYYVKTDKNELAAVW